MERISLKNGGFVLVSAEDLPLVSPFTWRKQKRGRRYYAYTADKHHRSMHRMLLGASKGQQVDHIDGNGLNNCRSNLRLCTTSQNMANAGKYRGHEYTSRYKGVSRVASHRKFRAQICKDGKIHYLGYFHSEHDAARAYNAAAVDLFGEFAKLNVIDTPLADDSLGNKSVWDWLNSDG